MSSFLRCLLALACAGTVGMAQADTPSGPQILTTDASRFYALYDSTSGRPSVAQLVEATRPTAVRAWMNWQRRGG